MGGGQSGRNQQAGERLACVISDENTRGESISTDGQGLHRLIMTFRDVEGTLETFSGDDGRSVLRWMEEFEETALICEWSDIHKAVYARRLLRGSAKLFVSFEDCRHSWKTMKKALQREFKPRIDSYEIYRRFQQRKKKNDETYHEYCYRMMEIGAQFGMKQSAIIQYIVEGIDGDEVSKMMLFGAKDIRELKSKLDVYEKIKNKPRIDSRVEILQKKATNKSADSDKTDECSN